ncbi:MAG: ABC transporter substrate-binding protein, partial [Oscillospiraceae bacterium]|nr:ABC transporter substrate-binding protein [Oscillospiraceae bacterium]
MKKVIALVLAFVMVFALCACGGGSDEKVIKIGVYEPQTGANGAGGKQEILGMEYANSVCPTVTIGGVEYKIELVYGDNESNTEKAVSAATKIISEGVSVVLGSYGSAVAIAASDTFKNAGVPAIGVT